MKAIILAAGRGSRMKELTDCQPKGLTKLNGMPLIAYQIQSLKSAGVTDIAICTGYRAEMFDKFNYHKFHNEDWANTNMVYTLQLANEWLERSTCIVSYSDIFYSPHIIKKLIKSEHDITISYDPNWLDLWSRRFENPLEDAETFRVDGNGKVLEIGGKTESLNEIEGQYMGLLRFTPNGWNNSYKYLQKLPSEERQKLDMTTMLSALLNNNVSIYTVINNNPWGEIDTRSDLQVYEQMKNH
jgi:choline kinase